MSFTKFDNNNILLNIPLYFNVLSNKVLRFNILRIGLNFSCLHDLLFRSGYDDIDFVPPTCSRLP